MKIDETKKSDGQITYEAYCEAVHWKSFNGKALPEWPDVKPEIQKAWIISAEALRASFQNGFERELAERIQVSTLQAFDPVPALRDEFAKAAMQALIEKWGNNIAAISVEAFKMADAMLAHRGKT